MRAFLETDFGRAMLRRELEEGAQVKKGQHALLLGDPDPSGAHEAELNAVADTLREMGEDVLRIVPGQADSQAMIAKGEIELGLYNISEIPEDKGLKLAGPVPAPQAGLDAVPARVRRGAAG